MYTAVVVSNVPVFSSVHTQLESPTISESTIKQAMLYHVRIKNTAGSAASGLHATSSNTAGPSVSGESTISNAADHAVSGENQQSAIQQALLYRVRINNQHG